MNKKAIEMQFHWIFVLIAGALILAFFFSVVQKQRSISEEKLSLTLASQMEAIYAGAIESKGTIQPLVTPQPGIAFSCSEVCDCNYYIGKRATEFRDKLIFAPDMIKGADTWAWALEWKFPFRVNNFLMLSSPTIKYNIIYEAGDSQSPQAFKRFMKIFPTELNHETFSSIGAVNLFTPQGDQHLRLIFVGIQPQSPSTLDLRSEFEEESVSGVYIDPDFRQVVFYEKSDPDELSFNQYESILTEETTAYAAMAAADHRMYNCMMQRAFKQLSVIADVQEERAMKIQDEMDDLLRLECGYDDAVNYLRNVATAAGGLSTSPDFSRQEQAYSALQTIRATQSDLENENRRLFRLGCPELF